MSSKPFSTRRALDNDFNLTITFVIPLVFWAIYVLSIMLFGRSTVVLAIAVIITVLSPVYLIWRLRKLRNFFEHGIEVSGELVKVYFYQDRGRIDYLYTFGGKKYNGSIAIHNNANTRSFTVGQEVKIVVDSERPERALVANLYSEQ